MSFYKYTMRLTSIPWLILCIGVATVLFYGNLDSVYAQEGEATGVFLKIDPSARSSAMGSAYTANESGGAYSAYQNPASLGDVRSTNLGLTHLDIFQGVTYQHASMIRPLNGSSAWGLSYSGIDFGSQNRTLVGPGGSSNPLTGRGSFGADDLSFGLSYGWSPVDRWKVGGTAKYVRKDIAGFNDETMTLDLGTQYRILPNLRAGLTLRNIIGDLQLDREADPLTRSLDVGLQWSKRWDVHSVTLNTRGSLPTDADAFASAGLEWGIWRTLYLRTGYNGDPEAGDGFTVGGGLRMKQWKLDYSLEDLGRLGDHSKLSFQYEFGGVDW